MTIASAFNEIAVAQGGTASKSGTITGALDALTDALADSDQPAPQTIEQGVRMLGEHIGGGGWTPGSSQVPIYRGTENPFPYYAATDPNIEHIICGGTIDEGVGLASGAYFAILSGMHAALYLYDDEGEQVGRVNKVGQAEVDGDPFDVYLIPELQEGVDNIEVAPDINLVLDNSTELTVKYKSGTSEKTFPNFESAGTTVTVKIAVDPTTIVVSYTPEGGSKTVLDYGMDIGWRFTMPDAVTTVTVELAS